MDKFPKGVIGGGLLASILAAVFAVEGGYVNDPSDPGGETNWGITERVARSHGYTGPMENLSQEQAAEIYYLSYIAGPGYDKLIHIQPALAHKLIDAGVNVGPKRATKWFQQALNSLNRGGKDFPNIRVDGVMGPSTLSAYQSLERVRGKVKACEMVLKILDALQTNHYISLTNLKQFTVGWVDHRIGNVSIEQCNEYSIE